MEVGFSFGECQTDLFGPLPFIIDLLAVTSSNAGGHIAHIGGALLGIWFANRISRGKVDSSH